LGVVVKNNMSFTGEMSHEELVSMRNYIETIIKIHQVEILRILHRNGVYLNENQNGTHVNLMDLPANVLEEIRKYLDYVKYQENSLDVDEKQKEEYKNTFFTKNNINTLS
jgi:hypothetical protein